MEYICNSNKTLFELERVNCTLLYHKALLKKSTRPKCLRFWLRSKPEGEDKYLNKG